MSDKVAKSDQQPNLGPPMDKVAADNPQGSQSKAVDVRMVNLFRKFLIRFLRYHSP